jgi:zinc protease
LKPEGLKPQFLDYKELISTKDLGNGIEFNSIKNKNNELFSLYYILEMGTDHDQMMGLAVSYLPYLGTDKYSAEELAQELFKLGVSFDVFTSRDRLYVTLRGLNSNLEEGVKLFEHILANVQPDEQALADMVDGIVKKRKDALKNKNQILFNAMVNYAQYGSDNPFKHIMSEEELRALSADALVQKIKDITSFKHYMFYYGHRMKKKSLRWLKRTTIHRLSSRIIRHPKYFLNWPLTTTRFILRISTWCKVK